MSTNTKLSKSYLTKITQPVGFLGKALGNLSKKLLLDHAVSLTIDDWPKLATKATSSVLDTFERKIGGQGDVRAGKGFPLFISSEDMDDIIKIVE